VNNARVASATADVVIFVLMTVLLTGDVVSPSSLDGDAPTDIRADPETSGFAGHPVGTRAEWQQ
jgi:hypothetical protein